MLASVFILSLIASGLDGNSHQDVRVCGRNISIGPALLNGSLVPLKIKPGVLSKSLKNHLEEINALFPGNHSFLSSIVSLVERNRWMNRPDHSEWLVDELLKSVIIHSDSTERYEALEERVVSRMVYFNSAQEFSPDFGTGGARLFKDIVESEDWDQILPDNQYRVGLFEDGDTVEKENYVVLTSSVLGLRERQPELFVRMMRKFIRYFESGWAPAQDSSGMKQLRCSKDRHSQMFYEIRIMRNDYRIVGSVTREASKNLWLLRLATSHVNDYGALLRRLGE